MNKPTLKGIDFGAEDLDTYTPQTPDNFCVWLTIVLEKGALSVIYASKEPEISQHPDNQRLLVQAIKELVVDENTQVLVTSHTPGLAGLLPSDSLRCVRKQADGTAEVSHCNDDDLAVRANELGVLPDRRVQALGFVEGTNDIEFLERVSAMLKPGLANIVDFTSDNRVALVPLGGGSLKHLIACRFSLAPCRFVWTETFTPSSSSTPQAPSWRAQRRP